MGWQRSTESKGVALCVDPVRLRDIASIGKVLLREWGGDIESSEVGEAKGVGCISDANLGPNFCPFWELLRTYPVTKIAIHYYHGIIRVKLLREVPLILMWSLIEDPSAVGVAFVDLERDSNKFVVMKRIDTEGGE